MRIIAGASRGRRILSVPKKMTWVRPISGRIRQSLFDILRPRVPASFFLDLFAGTGAVGLEAISRGAERVVFVDKDPRCLKIIEKNLMAAGWSKRGYAYRGDVLSSLSWIPYRSGVERFDLIFLGPPYKDKDKQPLALSAIVLGHIAQARLLAESGWVIVQHHQKEQPGCPQELSRFRQARYGDSRLSFFRWA